LVKIELLLESLRSGFTRDVVFRIKDIVPEFQPENGGQRTTAASFAEDGAEKFTGKRTIPSPSVPMAATDMHSLDPDELLL
jgi:hypothetical protein